MTKVCSKCGAEKPAGEFYRTASGYSAKCKECTKAYAKEYKSKHKKRTLEQRRERRSKRNQRIRDYLEEQHIPCMRCGKLVKIEVEPGTVIRHKFCGACASGETYGEVWEYADTRSRTTGPPKTYYLPVKTYRPGDRGFKQRAAEVMAHLTP